MAADVRAGATLPALTGLAIVLLVAAAAVPALGTVLVAVAAVAAHRGPPSGPAVPAPRSPGTSTPAPVHHHDDGVGLADVVSSQRRQPHARAERLCDPSS